MASGVNVILGKCLSHLLTCLYLYWDDWDVCLDCRVFIWVGGVEVSGFYTSVVPKH